MDFKKEKDKKSDVLEEMNSLAEKIQEAQERFENEVRSFSDVLELSKTNLQKISNYLLSIQRNFEHKKNALLEEFQSIKTHTKKLCELQIESDSSVGKISQKVFNDYLESLTDFSFEEKQDIWLCRPLLSEEDKIPRFKPISERSNNSEKLGTRFVSLINFKGGVGKTTLTANLAAAFSSGNYKLNGVQSGAYPIKVLVVDLDFQGTLSERCADPNQLRKAMDLEKLASELLINPKFSRYTIDDLTLKFEENENVFVIPSFDKLDRVDNEQFVRFATRRRDVRYRYRQWFHTTKIFESYDLVIFDCPPRKTPSSICALMASDFVFVPAAPETLDEQAVVRSTHWLISFKMRMDAPYVIGGFILNRTQDQVKLSSSEINFRERILYTLQNPSSQTKETAQYIAKYGTPSFLKTFIPKRKGEKSINGLRGELLPGTLKNKQKFPFFTELASEMFERIYQ